MTIPDRPRYPNMEHHPLGRPGLMRAHYRLVHQPVLDAHLTFRADLYLNNLPDRVSPDRERLALFLADTASVLLEHGDTVDLVIVGDADGDAFSRWLHTRAIDLVAGAGWSVAPYTPEEDA